MPIVIVYGVPPETSSFKLQEMIRDTKNAVASVAELGISEKQVSIFIQQDLFRGGLGEEIIVFVYGLLEMPARTPRVIRKVKAAVGRKIKKSYFPKAVVEVFVYPIASGLCWSSRR